jgi:hypothetical protein
MDLRRSLTDNWQECQQENARYGVIGCETAQWVVGFRLAKLWKSCGAIGRISYPPEV